MNGHTAAPGRGEVLKRGQLEAGAVRLSRSLRRNAYVHEGHFLEAFLRAFTEGRTVLIAGDDL
jgi:hypothetical protein